MLKRVYLYSVILCGEAGDVVHDLRDEVASLEEVLSQMGTSSKMPFHFV